MQALCLSERKTIPFLTILKRREVRQYCSQSSIDVCFQTDRIDIDFKKDYSLFF